MQRKTITAGVDAGKNSMTAGGRWNCVGVVSLWFRFRGCDCSLPRNAYGCEVQKSFAAQQLLQTKNIAEIDGVEKSPIFAMFLRRF